MITSEYTLLASKPLTALFNLYLHGNNNNINFSNDDICKGRIIVTIVLDSRPELL